MAFTGTVTGRDLGASRLPEMFLSWSAWLYPPNSHRENLMVKVVVLRGGAFGMCLGHEGGALVSEVSSF